MVAAEGTRRESRARLICSLVFRTTSRGDNAISAAKAGHSSWHRPHLVQASEERSCFHEKSSTSTTPGFSSSSMFGTGWGAPLGRGVPHKNVSAPAPRRNILVKGGVARDPE